jgi:hypothetical protein
MLVLDRFDLTDSTDTILMHIFIFDFELMIYLENLIKSIYYLF